MKILITGSSGFLGKKVRTVLEKGYEVVPTNPFYRKGEIELDILKLDIIEEVFKNVRPDVVVHLAGISDPDYCENNMNLAYAINVKGTQNIVRACKTWGARLLFSSTDYVFDGNNSPYNEKSSPCPVNIYGRTKAEAEACIIKEIPSNAAIMRFSILYGYNDSKDRETFVTKTLKILEAGQIICLDAKQVRYPVLLDDVAMASITIIDKSMSGLFHLTTKNGITKYDWALKIAKIFKKPNHNIIIDTQTMGIAIRPLNCQLINSRENELGITCHEVEQGMKFMYKQFIDDFESQKE